MPLVQGSSEPSAAGAGSASSEEESGAAPGTVSSYASEYETMVGGADISTSPAPGADAGEIPSVRHYSADGARMVQVEGREASAFLYDLTAQDADSRGVLIRYLARGVTDVRFSDTSRGIPLQIVLETAGTDGASRSRLVFDADGKPLGAISDDAADQNYGSTGAPGYDAAGFDSPPTEPPMPDGA
jgi:hypothetical protein